MTKFDFWRKWLLAVGVYLVVFGLYLAFFSRSTLVYYLFSRHIDPVFWPCSEIPSGVEKFQSWIYGVLGSVMAGWGAMITYWAYGPFRTQKSWAWNGLAVSIGIWYTADTLVSASAGVFYNVGFNSLMLLLLVLPLAVTRKDFRR